VLEFLCPNGHKIHCPAEQAGRAARCPQCGVRFRIPEPEDIESHASSKGFRDPPPKSGSKAAAKPAPPRSQPPDDEDLIEFLCPNGHRLHGPSSLQGHHGECPACGAKFRIPAYDEVPEEKEKKPKGKIRLVEVDEQEAEKPSAKPQAAQVQITSPKGEPQVPAVVDQPLTAVADSEARLTGHPLAELFSRLWAEKPKRASVELHFADGQTLVPVHFAKTLSREGYGVFAVEEPTATHTLTVVAWDSVVRVLIRGVEELPGEMIP